MRHDVEEMFGLGELMPESSGQTMGMGARGTEGAGSAVEEPGTSLGTVPLIITQCYRETRYVLQL